MGVAAVIIAIGLAVVLFQYLGNQGSDTLAQIGTADTSANANTVAIAQAIANAEGFNVAGSRPQRNNNPGDMTADLIGTSTGKDGSFVIYSDVNDGWNNLYAQVNAWLNGTSAHAGPDSTITDISQFYTSTDQESWATNVAASLGVDPSTSISQITG